jgi:7-cyano-7-deazaguanine synthase
MLSVLASHIQGTLIDGVNAIIYFGAHAEDAERSAYPDCTFQFTGAMANAIDVGTYHRVQLNVPWQFMTKDQIIKMGAELGTPYHMTWSCYAGGDLHCGVCPTCRARREAFIRAGVNDPTEYAK